ncbi:MAG: class I SAM-dependent methyltransferase [Chloroflexi bacterium]|nr:class I SAM-dependent methyltransferase [Chloroflexota bacterium]
MDLNENALHVMQCPLCGSALRLKEVFEEGGGMIKHGCVECDCDGHPVCFGILLLKSGHLKGQISALQKRYMHRAAAAFSLGNYSEDLARIFDYLEGTAFGRLLRKSLYGITVPYHVLRYRQYFNSRKTFLDLLDHSPYDDYLRHRFSAQSFWDLYPFLSSLKQKERVLEICSGAGHASFIISRTVSPSAMFCIDGNFRNLFLLQKFFSPGQLVLLDANSPLPFSDGTFDCVLMMDAFHYVESRYRLAKEIERVVNREGCFLILHIHNNMVENRSAGKPISPFRIQRLFSNPLTIVPEKELLEDFLYRDRFDLTYQPDTKALETTDAFCVAARMEKSSSEHVWEHLLNRHEKLAINPLYEIHPNGDRIVLSRRFPNPALKEYPLSDAYLPVRVEINGKILRNLEAAVEDDHVKQLRKQFVIINVPYNYC